MLKKCFEKVKIMKTPSGISTQDLQIRVTLLPIALRC